MAEQETRIMFGLRVVTLDRLIWSWATSQGMYTWCRGGQLRYVKDGKEALVMMVRTLDQAVGWTIGFEEGTNRASRLHAEIRGGNTQGA